MATTYPLIRDQMLSVIKALTPARHSSVRFVAHPEPMEFAQWCEANPRACFRRHELLNAFNYAMAGMANAGDSSALWQFSHGCALVMAYPRRELGQYGIGNERALDDVIDSDLAAIDAAIGRDGSAIGNWVSGLDDCHRSDVSASKTENAVFVTSTYQLLYDRSY